MTATNEEEVGERFRNRENDESHTLRMRPATLQLLAVPAE